MYYKFENVDIFLKKNEHKNFALFYIDLDTTGPSGSGGTEFDGVYGVAGEGEPIFGVYTHDSDDKVYIRNKLGIGTDSPGEKLHVSGNTVVTGDITAYYSDERLKTFKGKITDPLAKIKQINGYYFVENELAKSLGYDNDKLQVGVSAQEV